MAVEKLELLNLVADKTDMEKFLRRLALLENMHLINAMSEVNPDRFKSSAYTEEINKVLEAVTIRPLRPEVTFKDANDRLAFVMRTLDIPSTINKDVAISDYDFNESSAKIDDIYTKVKSLNDRLLSITEEEKLLDGFKFVKLLDQVEVNFKKLNDLEYFDVRVGTVTKDNHNKIAMNYDNIKAAMLTIGEVQGEEVVMAVFPKSLAAETDKLLKSVYYKDVELLEDYLDYPDKMRKTIEDRLVLIRQEKESLTLEMGEYVLANKETIINIYSQLVVEKTVTYMKNVVAETKNFFYIAGWLPTSEKKELEKTLEGLNYEVISVYKEAEDAAEVNQPPTKLRNNRYSRPFEMLTELYGVPNYFEVDPTPLLSIVYVIFFGAMFGDLGQGFVLVLAGFIAQSKLGLMKPGSLLKRMGFVSMIFGILYDSFFGMEYIIANALNGKPIGVHVDIVGPIVPLARPLENTMSVLMAAVGFGLLMLLVSYVFSIVNKFRTKQMMEATLGKYGINGLVMYASFLLAIATSVMPDLLGLPNMPFIVLLIASTAILLFREPIYNTIKKHRPLHHEPPVDYYVENGFELMETFIGFLSNSVSFVRIGAFAMNHAGLFLAFSAVGKMLDGGESGIATVILMIFGNLFVLTLEVLIVFIQGLRLSYYEMFSKFFVGEGLPWNNVEIKNYEVR